MICLFYVFSQYLCKLANFTDMRKNNLPEDYKLRDTTPSIASSEGMLPVSLEYPVKA